MLNPAAEAAIARLDTLAQCIEAVTELMIPETDLHIVNRDRLSMLFDFLAREYREALEGFTQTLRAQ